MNSVTGFFFDLISSQAKATGVNVISHGARGNILHLSRGRPYRRRRAGDAGHHLPGAGLCGACAVRKTKKKYLYLAVPGVFISFLVGVLFCYYLTPTVRHKIPGRLPVQRHSTVLVGSKVRLLRRQLPFLGWRDVRIADRHVLSQQARRSKSPANGEIQEIRVCAGIRDRRCHYNRRPDPINQTIISLPIYFLFELGVILARFCMTVTTGAYHTSADWPEVEAAPGVRRRVLSCGDAVMIVQFTIDEGAEVPEHSHPHEQIGHVVFGPHEVFGSATKFRELGPGDGYSVPGGVTHGAVGVTRTVAVDTFPSSA